MTAAAEATLDADWDIQGTVQFIERRGCRIVALQFPDELLRHAATVVRRLQACCVSADLPAQIYLLADTSYNSLAVDEVAAAHINADAMVHYGRASFAALSRVPTYFVLKRAQLDLNRCARLICEYAAAPLNPEGMKMLLVFMDQPLLWALEELQQVIQGAKDSAGLAISFAKVQGREREPHPSASGKLNADEEPTGSRHQSTRHQLGGYSWNIPEDVSLRQCIWLWVGEEDTQAQLQLQMTYHDHDWVMLDPEEGRWQDGVPLKMTRTLKRRYYLVEKAKNANVIGILVGTLGVAGYKDVIKQIRTLAQAAGKKTYTLLMGKPNPAKLANFPEIEIFVHIADPQGHILDSKEYYAPIITPFEAQLAFTPNSEWGKEYRLDFETLLHDNQWLRTASQGHTEAEPRFSLVDSRQYQGQEQKGGESASTALSLPPVQDLSQIDDSQKHLIEVKSAADYLKLRRTFQGLEAPITGAAAKQAQFAQPGRSGRAAQYNMEGRE